MSDWHIITCEYPPQIGGVADYTALLSRELRSAGDEVHVWAPGAEKALSDSAALHRVLGRFDSTSLASADRLLDVYPGPRTLMVQWVPHGYGSRSMNVGFCRWLARRVRRHGDRLQLMVHEPFLEFRGLRQSAVAAVHRWMISAILGASERVWLSIPAWEPLLRPYAPANLPMDWLPIPSTITTFANQGSGSEVRQRLGNPKILVGHLGTYSPIIRKMLAPVLLELLPSTPELSVVLLGANGEADRRELLSKSPELANRVVATGYLPDAELSTYLGACDLLIQPFPDGASSRRTSLMAGISHGVAVVTTSGHLSESLWKQSNAVAIVPASDPQALQNVARSLVDSPEERARLGAAGVELYRNNFDVRHTIARLRTSHSQGKTSVTAALGHQPR